MTYNNIIEPVYIGVNEPAGVKTTKVETTDWVSLVLGLLILLHKVLYIALKESVIERGLNSS